MSHRTARLRPSSYHALIGCLALAALAARLSADDELEQRRSPLVVAVERAKPAVVNIHGEKTLAVPGRSAQTEAGRRVNGMGTGVIIDPRGYIITNHHVVEGVRKITVTTADRETLIAQLISHDPDTDLAIIKIESAKSLPVIDIGTSNDLMPGETVVAVGNAYGYGHTVTRGIISALHRTVQVSDAQNYEDLIQTDASINPGNSGGPLLNIEGRMIGINVAVRAGAQGIGFAIPTDKALAVAAELLSTRRIGSVWHGVVAGSEAGTGDQNGLVVDAVDVKSPAAESGLKAGDVIKTIGDQDVVRALDLERALLGRQPGDEIEIVIEREDEPLTLNLVLAPAPQQPHHRNNPTWDLLGLELAVIPKAQFQQYRSRYPYRGGLSVTDVRPDGPAAGKGIQRGDILVGMHVWETISPDNVAYILGRPDFADLEPLKFYILRGNETFYGHLTVSHRRPQ
ncbi:MAG: trypsin-like peptidase domain-containing protein [Pirellulales bacterium]